MSHRCSQIWCQQPYEVTEEDLMFYEKVSPVFNGRKEMIPPPMLCPECRRQRKLAWRNERNFYQRTCHLCTKRIITVHAPENPYPVLCLACWRSQEWDPTSYAREYDSSRSFFDQFKEHYDTTPQRAVVSEEGLTCENCEYCFDISFSRNCYLCFGTWKIEDSLYSNISDQSRSVMDCYGVKLGSELAYECLDSQKIYRCTAVQNCENCSDCHFCFDLKGCSECIGCINLRQKKFCIFNEQYSEEAYRSYVQSISLSSRRNRLVLQQKFDEFSRQFPRRALNQQHCEDCNGDHLFHCKNVLGFVCTHAEHSRWIERSDGPKHCYDIVQSGNSEWSMEQITGDNTYDVHFSMYCNHSKHLLYCSDCLACKHCIGCISMRNASYCIFNKQYTPEEYETKASEIIASMRRDQEYGEFFPVHHSPFGYNETNAQEFYPLHEDIVGSRQWKWKQIAETSHETTIQGSDAIPDRIEDVSASITKEVYACQCGKKYKIIPQEFSMYQTLNVPIPEWCPDCRHRNRLARRNPYNLFEGVCMQCRKSISTTYTPERCENILCEACFQLAVY